MRQAFKSLFKTDLGNFFSIADFAAGFFEPLLYYPFLRRKVADFCKIALEHGKAATGVGRYFFHRKVVHVVFVQEFEDVNFPRLGKVEKRGVNVFVRVQQDEDAFRHFQIQQFFGGWYGRIEIGRYGFKQAANVGAVGGEFILNSVCM